MTKSNSSKGAKHAATQKAQDVADASREKADQVAGHAQQAAHDVAGTAKQQAGAVKDEAVQQATSLADTVQSQAQGQVSTQHQRLADSARTLTDDLHRVSRGEQPQSEWVGQGLQLAAERADAVTRRLENSSPAEMLDEVRTFAARRPGTFLALALGAGILAGRMTRGAKDVHEAGPLGPGDSDEHLSRRLDRDSRAGASEGQASDPTGPVGDVAPHHLDGDLSGQSGRTAGQPQRPTADPSTLPPGTVPVDGNDPITGGRA